MCLYLTNGWQNIPTDPRIKPEPIRKNDPAYEPVVSRIKPEKKTNEILISLNFTKIHYYGNATSDNLPPPPPQLFSFEERQMFLRYTFFNPHLQIIKKSRQRKYCFQSYILPFLSLKTPVLLFCFILAPSPSKKSKW